jgi:RNA polymerase sigma factor (sigma-70 family)
MKKRLLHEEQLDDTALISYIRKGNAQAENLLYIKYYDALLIYNKRILTRRDSHKAEDNLQDAIIVTIEKIRNGSYREQGELLAYMKKICEFSWLNKSRKKNILVKLTPEYYEVFPEEEECFENEEMLNCAEKALLKIDENCRSVLEAFYYKNMGMRELLNEFPFLSTIENAKRRKYKCKEKLKKTALDYYQKYQN